MLLLISSCDLNKVFVAENSYGTEEIKLNRKGKKFKFIRNSSSLFFENGGDYYMKGDSLVLIFREELLDSRYLPNFKKATDSKTWVNIEKPNLIKIKFIDEIKKTPILLQDFYIYNATGKPLLQEQTNIDGEYFLDSKYADEELNIYCSFYNPINFKFAKGNEYAIELNYFGNLTMENPNQDVILLNGIEFKFEYSRDRNRLQKLIENNGNKIYNRIK